MLSRGLRCAEFPPLDGTGLDRAARHIAELGSLLLVHAEDPARIAAARNGGGTDYATFLRSRPAEAETAAIAAVLGVARRTGVRAHILHVSAAEALPLT